MRQPQREPPPTPQGGWSQNGPLEVFRVEPGYPDLYTPTSKNHGTSATHKGSPRRGDRCRLPADHTPCCWDKLFLDRDVSGTVCQCLPQHE